MREIIISTRDTDDSSSSVNYSIAALCEHCLQTGSPLLIFDNGSNEECVEEIMRFHKENPLDGVVLLTGSRNVEEVAGIQVLVSPIQRLSDVKLPAQFIMIAGSEGYLMRRGHEWHGYLNQPESTRLAKETYDRIRRLFF